MILWRWLRNIPSLHSDLPTRVHWAHPRYAQDVDDGGTKNELELNFNKISHDSWQWSLKALSSIFILYLLMFSNNTSISLKHASLPGISEFLLCESIAHYTGETIGLVLRAGLIKLKVNFKKVKRFKCCVLNNNDELANRSVGRTIARVICNKCGAQHKQRWQRIILRATAPCPTRVALPWLYDRSRYPKCARLPTLVIFKNH